MHPRPVGLNCPRSLMIPKKGSVYDFVYMKRQFGTWNTWSNLIEKLDLAVVTKTTPVSENFCEFGSKSLQFLYCFQNTIASSKNSAALSLHPRE